MKTLALTLDLIGSLFIAFAALRVHYRVLNEHKMDRQVFKTMRREQYVGIAGVVLISLGYILNIASLY